MQKKSETIVFFGSGPVAAKSLEFLSKHFDIETVITKPAITHKRDPVPVISLAEKLDLKILTPTNKLELDNLFKSANLTSKIGIIIDFGVIVSQRVIDYFPLGIINSHFSLLPEWRGADPITFSILSGQSTTGVSLMVIDAAMDEGDLIAQESIELTNTTTEPELTHDLIELSNSMLVKYLPDYISGDLKPFPQPDDISPSYSRKLTKQDGIIDWNKAADQIDREIRAFIEWPKSRAVLNGLEVIITKASVIKEQGEPGSIRVSRDQLVIFAKTNALQIESLKPAGKNNMDVRSFLAGYKNTLS
jgi:methionyl-tRNA formyltransferase